MSLGFFCSRQSKTKRDPLIPIQTHIHTKRIVSNIPCILPLFEIIPDNDVSRFHSFSILLHSTPLHSTSLHSTHTPQTKKGSPPSAAADTDAENRAILNELGEKPVTLDLDFGHIVVVDGLPIAPEKAATKLEDYIARRFGRYTKRPEKIHMFLTGEEGKRKTNGFAFLEFKNTAQAEEAVRKVDGRKLDNKHTMRVSSYNDFLKHMDTPQEFPDLGRDPEQEAWLADLRADLKTWTTDEFGRDMYVVRYAEDCEINWNDPHREPKSARETLYQQTRDNERGPRDQLWAERNVTWSPQGSILASQHAQGVRLWGGKNFHLLAQFRHEEVQHLIFSPREGFLITSNGRAPKKPGDEPATIIWNVFTEEPVESFPPLSGPFQLAWSYDDQYLSYLLPGEVQIFRVHQDRLELLEKLEIPGVEQVRWSPDQHLLVYTVPEKDNVPCRVVLASVLPKLETVRERQLYSVKEMEIRWQGAGDFLSVKMLRHRKGRPTGTNLEIFRVREKDIPVETLEFPEAVFDVQWEPSGRQLLVIHGEALSMSSRKVDLFSVQKKKLRLRKTWEDRPVSFGSWAPLGGYVVLVGPEKGHLEFLDTVNLTSIAVREHFMMNDLGWSPDGQYLLTACCKLPGSDWRVDSETGYKVWSKLGEPILERKVELCYKVQWRPRPPSPLTAQEKAKIKSELKQKYWKRFEQEDEELRYALQGSEAQEQLRLREEWRKFRAVAQQRFTEEKLFRKQKFGEDTGGLGGEEEEFVEVETVVDHEIDSRAEVISGGSSSFN